HNFPFYKEFIVNGGNFEPLAHRNYSPVANADRRHLSILPLNANLGLLAVGDYICSLHVRSGSSETCQSRLEGDIVKGRMTVDSRMWKLEVGLVNAHTATIARA